MISNSLLVEVIDGPMDGLNCVLSRNGTIGRNVGNALSLGLDMEISGRHAEILQEGPSWCVRDLQSTNGTWFRRDRLVPGRSYPLPESAVLMMGATVLEFFPAEIKDGDSTLREAGFKDPREEYQLTSDLRHVWDVIYSSEEMAAGGGYCDTRRLVLRIMKTLGHSTDRYECVGNLEADNRFAILEPWLSSFLGKKPSAIPPGLLMVAPRVWRVMGLAASRRQGNIGVGDILGAMLEEGRSLAARHMLADRRFMSDFGPKLKKGASDRTVIEVLSGTSPGKKEAVRKNVVSAVTSSVSVPDGPSESTTHGGPHVPLAERGILVDALRHFGVRLERIILGFLEDAVNPLSGQRNVEIAGLHSRLDDIFSVALPPADRDNHLKTHLDLLFNLLIVVLAAQREGYRGYGEKFGVLLQQIAHDACENRSGVRLPLGKKTIDPDELAQHIRKVMQQLECDGQSEQLIREIIRKKLEKMGLLVGS